MVKVCPIVSRYLSLPRLIPLVAKESYCAEQDRERAREGHPQGERPRRIFFRRAATAPLARKRHLGVVVASTARLWGSAWPRSSRGDRERRSRVGAAKRSPRRSPTSATARSRAWTPSSCGTSVSRRSGPRSRVAGPTKTRRTRTRTRRPAARIKRASTTTPSRFEPTLGGALLLDELIGARDAALGETGGRTRGRGWRV